MTTEGFASVWDTTEDTPGQADAARRLGVTQPRVSDCCAARSACSASIP